MAVKTNIRRIVFAGVIAALYAALTIAIAPIAYGPLQFRIAEALCILPFFFPAAVPGLFIGCIIANLLSPYGMLDVVVGSAASLFAALCTMQIGKGGRGRLPVKVIACLPPVVFNAVFIGALIAWFTVGFGDIRVFFIAFAISGLQVGLGQLVIMYVLGLPLMVYLPKSRAYFKLAEYYFR